MRINKDRMIGVLGPAPKPAVVWEKQFDGVDELAQYAKLDWQKIPEACLWHYFHDLAYMELQPDLFRYLFPVCLKFWYQTLMRNQSAERGDAEFHYGLMRGNVIEKMFLEKQRILLYDFFRDGLLDRIESQESFLNDQGAIDCSRSSQWIYRLNTLGQMVPVIKPIWQNWWNLDNPGKARCASMYASGLIYFSGENPLYAAWTHDKGGGGPYLTETDGTLYDWSWRDDNLTHLKNTLSPDYIVQKLETAAQMLSNSSDRDISRRIFQDAQARQDTIAIRISDLLDNLARIHSQADIWDGNWSRIKE